MHLAAEPARKRWWERMSPDERAHWFRFYTPEQFAAWFDEQVRLGVFPAKCEDPATLAMIAQMVVDTLSRPGDLDVDEPAEAAA